MIETGECRNKSQRPLTGVGAITNSDCERAKVKSGSFWIEWINFKFKTQGKPLASSLCD